MASRRTDYFLNGGILSYRCRHEGQWDFDLRRIVAVGEYTIAVWPGADDYFEVFVDDHFEWRAMPMYHETWNEVRDYLEREMGVSIQHALVNRTSWAHTVVWPIEARGLPLFKTQGNVDRISDELRSFFNATGS